VRARTGQPLHRHVEGQRVRQKAAVVNTQLGPAVVTSSAGVDRDAHRASKSAVEVSA
jgi:hypothetical protein